MKFGRKKPEPVEGGVVLADQDVPGFEDTEADETTSKSSKKVDKNDPSTFEYASPVRPSAFLLPKYLSHQRALAAAKKRASSILVWGLLVIMALSLGSFGLKWKANIDLNAAQVDRTEAQQVLKSLAPLAAFFDGLDVREASVRQTLTSEVSYGEVVTAVTDALPGGSKLTSLTTKFGEMCPGPDPFNDVESIGCIDFSVEVRSKAHLQTFLARANRESADKVVSFIVTNISEADGRTTASGTANFTSNTFTYRFGNKPKETEDQQGQDTPAPSPAPSASATTEGAQAGDAQ